MINVKEILIVVDDEEEVVPIAKVSDEELALSTGADDFIYGYVPDDVFDEEDEVIAKYVEKYLV